MKRHEREIEEILQKIVDFPGGNGKAVPPRRPKPSGSSLLLRVRQALAKRPSKLTTGHLIVAALVVTVLGFALADYAPRLAPFISLIAVVLFVLVFARAIRRGRSKQEQRWRGRIVEFPRKKTDPWHQLGFNITIMLRSFRRWIGWR